MRVFYDGLIYAMQSVGGVSRIYNELIPRITAADGLDVTLSLRLRSAPHVAMPGVRTARFLTLPDPYASTNPLRRAVDGAIRPLERAWLRLRTGRPDVYHPTYYMAPRFRGVPTVVTVYDMIHERFPEYYPTAEHDRFRTAKAACIRAADHVLCISEATRRDAVEMLGVPPERTTVTLLGTTAMVARDAITSVAAIRAAQHVLRSEPFSRTMVFVGQRGSYKNAARLMTAMADARLANCRLLFVGGEPVSGEEIALANSLEPGPDARTPGRLPLEPMRGDRPRYRMDFLGQVSDAALKALYQLASAVVCPSLYEGFGLPVLEAMAVGAVVACSNTSSLPEVAGECAFYFDPRSPESIADSLVKAMSLSDAERQAWAVRAKARAALFSWDKTAEQTLAVYRRVAK